MVVRDLSGIRPGRAAYTLWCDDRGFVMEDGVLFCQSEREWLLTSARPSMGWFADHRHGQRVEIEDVSDAYGMLQVQGPRSRAALAGLDARGRGAAVLRARREQDRQRPGHGLPAPATPATWASS